MSKKKSVWQRMRSGWQVYALLLLPVIYLIVFCYIPMGGLVLAFKKYDLSKGILGSPWVGFDNFLKFFRSYKFTIVLKNTLTLAVYSLLVGFQSRFCSHCCCMHFRQDVMERSSRV